jgi:hypothetical protein
MRSRRLYADTGVDPMPAQARGTILIADHDFGDVDIERAIIDRAGL